MFKKMKGRYAERKTNKERSVISYEDMPLEDYEQEKTEISPKAVKRIILAAVVVVVLVLAVLAFVNRDKLTWDNLNMWWNYEVMGNSGKGYPVNIIGDEVEAGNFSVYQGRTAYASDTSFVTLNSTGNEIHNSQLRYSKPVMKSCENRFLIFGLGDSEYQIQSFDSKIYTGSAEGIIYAGDIASNGRYCFVTEGNGFYTELYAFDKNNNRVFKYSFSEYYINSVAINKNGTGCVACGISNSDGNIKTGVYVLEFSKEEPVAKYELQGDFIVDSKFVSSSRAVLVGANASYVVRVDNGDYATVDYGGKPVENYCFNLSAGTFTLALSKSGDGRSCSLITYNDNGEAIFEIANEFGAEALTVYGGTTAVLDGNTVYTYDRTGKLKYTSDAGTGAKRVILISDTEAFVLSVNQVRKIDLTKAATSDSAK